MTTATAPAVDSVEKPGTRRRPSRPGTGVGRPGFAWAAPAALFFGLFAIVPLALVLVLSFTRWNGLGSPEFAGLE
ncbi:sugar ABC transporter permease, partial [Streptomyces hydrogenans]